MRDTLDKVYVAFMVIMLIFIIGLAIYGLSLASTHSDSSDDVPSWAKESASQLEKNGGGVNVYRTWGDSNYGYTTSISVTKGSKVVADSTGINVIYNSGGVTHFPYDRIASIYINTGA